MFWCDGLRKTLEQSDLHGMERKVLFRGTDVVHPFGLALDDNYLYVSDWNYPLST